MWTRDRNKEDGTFGFTVYNEAGTVVARETGFADHREAERRAQEEQRRALFPVECADIDMTDDELMVELFGEP